MIGPDNRPPLIPSENASLSPAEYKQLQLEAELIGITLPDQLSVQNEQKISPPIKDVPSAKATALSAKNLHVPDTAVGGGMRLMLAPTSAAVQSRSSSSEMTQKMDPTREMLRRVLVLFAEAEKSQNQVNFDDPKTHIHPSSTVPSNLTSWLEKTNAALDPANPKGLPAELAKAKEELSKAAALAKTAKGSKNIQTKNVVAQMKRLETVTNTLQQLKNNCVDLMKAADTYTKGRTVLESLGMQWNYEISDEENIKTLLNQVKSLADSPEKLAKMNVLLIVKMALADTQPPPNEVTAQTKLPPLISVRDLIASVSTTLVQHTSSLAEAGKVQDAAKAKKNETCMMAFGELHSNLTQKISELSAIEQLPVDASTKRLAITVIQEMRDLQQTMLPTYSNLSVRETFLSPEPKLLTIEQLKGLNLKELDAYYKQLDSKMSQKDVSAADLQKLSRQMYDLRSRYSEQYVASANDQVIKDCCHALSADGHYGKLAESVPALLKALMAETPSTALNKINFAVSNFASNTMEQLTLRIQKNLPPDAPERAILQGFLEHRDKLIAGLKDK